MFAGSKVCSQHHISLFHQEKAPKSAFDSLLTVEHGCWPACSATIQELKYSKSHVQSKGKERVICLTAERRTKRRGFKGSLHVCKVSSGAMQVGPHRHMPLSHFVNKNLRLQTFCWCTDTEILPAEVHYSLGSFSFR